MVNFPLVINSVDKPNIRFTVFLRLFTETVEDKPIDEVPAEEVADEEIDENNENREDAEDQPNNRDAEEVPEDETEENREPKEKDSEPVRKIALLFFNSRDLRNHGGNASENVTSK